ncbi:hypothetical protein EVAR_90840_1 [Eumeta japonica]|uniref:Peptidase A2 domain-containing protein n=1 Tax=Eumeta variegata TaxID=151549 RepID=A0A4C1ZSK0_EUMVA|nr:hypothetical protein EVAR_90840_1 [Eumeta japonica]
MYYSVLTRCILYILAHKRAVLLQTAMVQVMDSCGQFRNVRALLDTGSQSTFISESCGAIRVLNQLSNDEDAKYPAAARLLCSSVYMDDILGGRTEAEAKQLMLDLTKLLSSAGFELRKWTSNNAELLSDIPRDHLEKPHVFDNADGISYIKILGIQWNSSTDRFTYHLNLPKDSNCTKRTILSALARTYDPLGWIAPVILQENIKIERHCLLNAIQHCSLHGFADASEAGTAAVYLRVVDSSGRVKLSLMMAKSRVAPIKTKLTIPKLELCGAALVTKILDNVFYSIRDNVEIHDMVCWTDSTIVLSWLQTPPHLLQTFEGNRVSLIINCGFKIKWRHLPSQMNPADVVSRGCNGAELLMHPLWWGPEWLQNAEKFWPQNLIKTEHNLPGLRKKSTVAHICAHELKFELIERTRARPAEPLMSDLPADRVTSSGVFNTVQTDFAEQRLTYEGLSTVFARIEAVLNSRPLCPLSHDSNEFEVLTPAHLLIGKSLLAVPEYDWDETPMSRLSRFQSDQRSDKSSAAVGWGTSSSHINCCENSERVVNEHLMTLSTTQQNRRAVRSAPSDFENGTVRPLCLLLLVLAAAVPSDK